MYLVIQSLLIALKFSLPQVWMLMVNAFFWNATSTTFHVLINNYIVHRLSLIEREAALSITILGMLPLLTSCTT